MKIKNLNGYEAPEVANLDQEVEMACLCLCTAGGGGGGGGSAIEQPIDEIAR